MSNRVKREQVLEECRNTINAISDSDIRTLIGKTMVSVENTGEEIVFTTDKDSVYALYHESDCCENVFVEDVCGELDDLVGTPILYDAEVSSDKDLKALSEYAESYTWTFYKLSTIHGSVTIRFYGSSNGYYSEGVTFGKR